MESSASKTKAINWFIEMNPVFEIVADDAKQAEKMQKDEGYKGLNGMDFLDKSRIYESKTACWQLSGGNIKLFEEIYDSWDIEKVYDRLALKLAIEYKEPPPKKKKRIR